MSGHINDLLHGMFNLLGSLNVALQDQTTPTLIVPFHNTVASSTVAIAPTTIDDYTVELASVVGFAIGNYFTMYNVAGSRWYQGTILGIAANVITLDNPIDFAYQIGDKASNGSVDLNVNGNITPQIFNVRLPEPGLGIIGDITRIILVMETTAQPAWNMFGDIVTPVGMKGLVFRRVDGLVQNIFNCKSNSDFANIMFDFDPIDQGKFNVYGVKGRLTAAGASKLGVTWRIAEGEDLQIIIQDDLSTLLKFRIFAEGHIVDQS